MIFESVIGGRRRTGSSDRPQVGLVWDDTYQLVLLVWLGHEQCTLSTDLKFQLGTRVVIDLGGGYLVLGTIVDDTSGVLTVSFAERLAEGERRKLVPRNVLLAAGAPRHAVSLARKDAFPCKSVTRCGVQKIGEDSFRMPGRLMRSAAIGVVLWSSIASAETYGTIDVSTGVRYESNPFLRDEQDTETASAQARLRSSLRYEDPSLEIEMSGFVDYREYFNRYGSDTAWGVEIIGTQQFDPLTSMNFSARALTSGRGATRFATGSLPLPDAGLPDPVLDLPDPEVPDFSELGSSRKTRHLSGALGIDRRLSEIETINIGVRLQDVSTSDEQTGVVGDSVDYRSGTVLMGYTRTVSARTSLVADVQGSLVNYGNNNQGDGLIANASAGIDTALNERVTARATVGASYSRRELANGSHDQAVTPSFAASACRRTEKSTSCLSATRAVQPTTSGRVRKITAFAATQSWRLSSKEQATLNVSYGQNDDFRVADEAKVNNQYVAMGGSYRREIAERLYFNISPGFERRFGETGRDGASNLFVNVGLSYRIGSSGG